MILSGKMRDFRKANIELDNIIGKILDVAITTKIKISMAYSVFAVWRTRCTLVSVFLNDSLSGFSVVTYSQLTIMDTEDDTGVSLWLFGFCGI